MKWCLLLCLVDDVVVVVDDLVYVGLFFLVCVGEEGMFEVVDYYVV